MTTVFCTFLIMVLVGIVVIWKLFRLDLFFTVRKKAPNLPLKLVDIIGLKLRGSRPESVIEPAIAASMSGLEVDLQLFEAHVLAGGKLDKIVTAMIISHEAGLEITFGQLAAEDLSGRDPMNLVNQ